MRFLALIGFFVLFSLSAAAQFGKPKPTPKNAAEYFAERALVDAGRLAEGSYKDALADSDIAKLERSEARLAEALEGFTALCEDRSLPRDQWARNCFALGHMHRKGQGTEQDYAAAKIHYDAACLEGRHLEACMQQAYTSHKGSAGERDYEHARLLYSSACDLRHAGACAGLGNMLYRGLGGTEDRPKGTRLMQDACRDQYEWACSRLSDYGLPVRIDSF